MKKATATKPIIQNKEITCYDFGEDRKFFILDTAVFAFRQSEVFLLVDVPKADHYTIVAEPPPNISYIYDYRIIAYSENFPIYTACYSHSWSPSGIIEKSKLTVLGKGYEEGSYICRMSREIDEETFEIIVIINKKGEITLRALGKNCYIKKIGDIPHYITENEDSIEIYSLDGKKVM